MKRLHPLCHLTILLSTIALAQSNPVPLINQPLVPDSTKPGSGGFTLTINGTGFSASSVVSWNGSTRITQFISESQLTADIKASDVSPAGTASVNVINSPPGGGPSNVVLFPIRDPGPSVGLFQVVSFPTGPVNAVGDFNNDGHADVAIGLTNQSGGGTINVYPGKGDGTFGSPIVSDTVVGVSRMLVADFNGDGKLDLAVLFRGTTTIFLGRGDGTFFQQQVFRSPSSAMAAGDFNRDGNLDLVVTDERSVSVYLGKGDGTFTLSQTLNDSSGGPAVGDFNGDGYLDLAVTGGGNVNIYLGNGDGTFQSGGGYSQLYPGTALAAVDVNEDGKLDLVSSGFSVLLGNGDGTFTTAGGFNLADQYSSCGVIIGDFNGDQKVDVLVGNTESSGTFQLLLGNNNGTFQSPLVFPVGPYTYVSVGDFNSDGGLDVVADYLYLQIPVSLSPTSVAFGNQTVGTRSKPQAVTLTNNGGSALSITAIKITGNNSNDFAQTNNCGTSLPAGASCKIKVTFKPKQQGQASASLTVAYRGLGSPQSVALSGTGTPAGTVSLKPPSLTFATQTIGTTSPPQTATLTNTGSVPVNISNIKASLPFSENNNCPSSLPVGDNCQIKVEFSPIAKGPALGTLSVADDAKGNPQTVSLSGTGTVVQLSPSGINFGDQKVGTKSAAVPVRLTNVGTTKLDISQIAITGADAGDFAEANNCGTSVPPGGSCTIKVTFKPTAKGQRSASLAVSDDGGGSPQMVALSGTGT
jgi:hypothetical protein